MINQYLLGHKVEVTDGKRIWYVAELSGFIVEINLSSKELKCIWKIPNSVEACSYRALFYCVNKLYVFPYYQRIMYVYDLYTAKYEKFEVKKGLEFMGCVKRGQFLYAFGAKSEILKYNLKNNTITYIDIQSKLKGLMGMPQAWFWTRSFVLDECIYIPVSNSNTIIVLDQQDKVSCLYLGNKPEKWLLENIQADSGGYHAIYCKGEIGNVRTYISEYDLNGRLIVKNSVEEKYSYQLYPFVDAVWVENKWICLPFGRNEILLRDEKQDEILFEIDNGTAFLSDAIQGLFFCSVPVDNDILYSINQSTGSLICIALSNLTVNYSYLEMKENLQCLIGKGYQDAVSFHSVIKEVKGFYGLQGYINYICNSGNQQINLEQSE